MNEADIAKLLQNAKYVEISPEYIVERINSYRQHVKDFIYQQKKKKKMNILTRSKYVLLYNKRNIA